MMSNSKHDGQSLCRKCGLCCTSFFSTGYVDNDDEKHTIEGFRGEFFSDEKGQLCFRQPCPGYNNGCSVHPNHPRSCKGFECALLKQLLKGEIDIEPALSLVKQTQQAVAQIDKGLFNLLGERTVTTGEYLLQFNEHAGQEEDEKEFKKRYTDILKAHAVFMFLRGRYFDEP